MHILSEEPTEEAVESMSRMDWRRYSLGRFRRLEKLMLLAIASNLPDLIKLGQDLFVMFGF